MSELDGFGRKILNCLQADGRLTNAELGEAVGLSPSQVSRRRSQMEDARIIRGYHAEVDPLKVGVGIVCMISVNLGAHSETVAAKFHNTLLRLPNVLEAYALTGEMDYSLKVVAKDLSELNTFISSTLLPHEAVQSVKTSIVLNTIKQSYTLPL